MNERARLSVVGVAVLLAHGLVVLVTPFPDQPPSPRAQATRIGFSAPVTKESPLPVDRPAVSRQTEAAQAVGPTTDDQPDEDQSSGLPWGESARVAEPLAEPHPLPSPTAPTPATAPVVSDLAVLARLTYPAQALRRRLEATVILELTIDENGVVTQVEVVEDPGHGFGVAALRALRGMVATPALVEGRPSPSRLRYPVRFVLP